MKKYLIFDLDGTLLKSNENLINLVVDFLWEKYDISKQDFLYFLNQTRWVSLKEQLREFFKISGEKLENLTKEVYNKIMTSKNEFFIGVPEKIKELSKKYTLFLSTWNSTIFAEENLEKANIKDLFLKILWSEKIAKWPEHINIFKNLVNDENFEENAIFIWDWQNDRAITKHFKMDFIHIDENLENKYNDKYEIKSVGDIDKILEKFKK